jgi:hypothetical protein
MVAPSWYVLICPNHYTRRERPGKRVLALFGLRAVQSEAYSESYSMSHQAIDALEDGWLQLRRLARDRASVSKSSTTEQALEELIWL